jgi:hypothetical protein
LQRLPSQKVVDMVGLHPLPLEVFAVPRRLISIVVILVSILSASAASAAACPRFGPVRVVGTIRSDRFHEISGVASSRRHRDLLWVTEDSGNGPFLSAVSPNGRLRARMMLRGAENYDWEDMAAAGGRIWIGDIGDNAEQRPYVTLYWLREPRLGRSSVRPGSATMVYPNRQPHNAEAMIVDGQRDQLLIFSKDSRSDVFRADLAHLRSGDRLRLRRVARLPLSYVTAADISRRGIIVKGYSSGRFYPWTRSRRPVDALSRRPCPEPVGGGESIAFDRSAEGYYTIPEGLHPRVSYAS